MIWKCHNHRPILGTQLGPDKHKILAENCDYILTYWFKHVLGAQKNRLTTYVTGLRSTVGNMSGYRCESDCRSRGSEFDPGRSHTFMEMIIK